MLKYVQVVTVRCSLEFSQGVVCTRSALYLHAWMFMIHYAMNPYTTLFSLSKFPGLTAIDMMFWSSPTYTKEFKTFDPNNPPSYAARWDRFINTYGARVSVLFMYACLIREYQVCPHIHVYMYICIYVYIHIVYCTCMYTYMHTYIHTLSLSLFLSWMDTGVGLRYTGVERRYINGFIQKHARRLMHIHTSTYVSVPLHTCTDLHADVHKYAHMKLDHVLSFYACCRATYCLAKFCFAGCRIHVSSSVQILENTHFYIFCFHEVRYSPWVILLFAAFAWFYGTRH